MRHQVDIPLQSISVEAVKLKYRQGCTQGPQLRRVASIHCGKNAVELLTRCRDERQTNGDDQG